MEIELREWRGLEVRVEDSDEGPVITGRGVPYNEWSAEMGGFRERFLPGSLRETVAEDDIRGVYNHDTNLVIGRRSVGTLRLREEEDGLHYEADVNPDDPDMAGPVARIRRRDVSGNSFGFWIEDRKADQEWEERDGILWRTIKRARLREIGPQPFPAYPQSGVSVRGADDLLEEARRWLQERRHHGHPDVLRRRLALKG